MNVGLQFSGQSRCSFLFSTCLCLPAPNPLMINHLFIHDRGLGGRDMVRGTGVGEEVGGSSILSNRSTGDVGASSEERGSSLMGGYGYLDFTSHPHFLVLLGGGEIIDASFKGV